MPTVGVLALQGGYAAHAKMLGSLGVDVLEVKGPEELARVDGLVLPGGESTTQWKMLVGNGLVEPLRARITEGMPVLATCAGAILLASSVENPAQDSLGLLNVHVRRNAYGRQRDSFEGESDEGHPLVFIRAPRFERIGSGLEVVAHLDGDPVGLRSGTITALAFHPELTDDTRWHAELLRAANAED